MATLETRVISGKGILRIDKDAPDFKKSKVLTVYCNVIREPLTPYKNYNYNPPQSQYAYLVFLREDYVVRTEQLKYEQQCFDFYPDISAQTLYAVECAYAGILQSFVNLGIALGAIPTTVTNNIEDWRHQDLFFDTIKVVCYASTAVQIDVVSNSYDLCPEQTSPEPPPPPPPPEPPPKLPPDTPLDEDTIPVSPPYDGADDDGDTTPFDGDQPPPPPLGCWETYTTFTGGLSPVTDYTVGLSTDIPQLRLQSGASSWELYDAGSGRTMRTGWVGSSYTPTLQSAIWRDDCPVDNPEGIPAT